MGQTVTRRAISTLILQDHKTCLFILGLYLQRLAIKLFELPWRAQISATLWFSSLTFTLLLPLEISVAILPSCSNAQLAPEGLWIRPAQH